MTLKNKHILITGCSFIGIHLLKGLIESEVAYIRVVNKTDQSKKYIKPYLKNIDFQTKDLRDLSNAKKALKGIDIVFHLAADHGGRGYVDLFQADTASNFLLDGSVFYAALHSNIEKIFFASSGCVYPNYLQKNINEKVSLKESDVKTPYDADNMYGWAKLMGELTLKKYYQEYGLKSAIGRLFTVFGEYASESHAVMGSIAKAFIKQDPYLIWGDGTQIRNWTYVNDIVNGILLATEKIGDATSINIGTNEKITVNKMVESIFDITNFHPKKLEHINMPTGPLNRVADISKAKKLLKWQPKYKFQSGLKKTIEWYYDTKDPIAIKKNLKKILTGNKKI